jgi:hypothetical protein
MSLTSANFLPLKIVKIVTGEDLNYNRWNKIQKSKSTSIMAKVSFTMFFVDGKVSFVVKKCEGEITRGKTQKKGRNRRKTLFTYIAKCIIIIKWCTKVYIYLLFFPLALLLLALTGRNYYLIKGLPKQHILSSVFLKQLREN